MDALHLFLLLQLETENRCMPREGQRECSGWYRLKLFFEGLQKTAAAGGGTFLSLSEVCVEVWLFHVLLPSAHVCVSVCASKFF